MNKRSKLLIISATIFLLLFKNLAVVNAGLLDFMENPQKKDLEISSNFESKTEIQPLEWKLELNFNSPIKLDDFIKNIFVEVNGVSLTYKNSYILTDSFANKFNIPDTDRNPRKSIVIIPTNNKLEGEYKITVKEGLTDINKEAQLKKDTVIIFNAKNYFTVSKIETDVNNTQRVDIYFTYSIDMKVAKNYLKIVPSMIINYEHYYHGINNLLRIYGNFKRGEKYFLFFAEGFSEAVGRKLEKGIDSFIIPDLPPSIKFFQEDTVIERDSRQMLNVKLINVNEVLFEGIKVPPIFIPLANKSKDNETFEKLKILLEARANEIKSKNIDPLFMNFVTETKYNTKLFFNNKPKNVEYDFSIPLEFRDDKEKGSVELIRLTNNNKGQPCNTDMRLFRVSDIGITHKSSQNSLLVWVTSLKTGKPVKDAPVLFISNDFNAYAMGKTNNDGLLFVENDKKLYPGLSLINYEKNDAALPFDKINMIIVKTQNDYSYIRIDNFLKIDGFDQRRVTEEQKRYFKGYVFTERGIYQPGETVHFKGTVREYAKGEVFVPKGAEFKIKIVNSKNEEVYNKKFGLTEFGTLNDNLLLKPFFPLGTYTIVMATPGTYTTTAPGGNMTMVKPDNELVLRTFEVQEFKPPRHFVDISYERKSRTDKRFVNIEKKEEYLECRIIGKYYAGGPVKNGQVRWKINISKTDFKSKDYEMFSFGYPATETELLETGESILDEKGEITLNIPLSKEVLSGIESLELIATVLDFDGKVSTTNIIYQITPSYLVGISEHPERVKSGDRQVAKIIVIDEKGKKINKGELNVSVLQVWHTSVRKRNENGDLYWASKKIWNKQYSAALNIADGEAIFDFDFNWGGDYLLSFSYIGKDGKEYKSGTIYNVEGYGYYYDDDEYKPQPIYEKVTLIPEKNYYSEDENIKILVNSKKRLSSCLLTIERDDIIEYRLVDVSEKTNEIKIPVKDIYYPNIYISLFGTVERGDFPTYSTQFDLDAPTFLFGYVNIEVKKQKQEVKIAINEKDKELKAEPGSEVELNIKSADDKGNGLMCELAIGVVDESVLALTGYNTPRLEELIRFMYPLSVFTYELRTMLLKQTPFSELSNFPLTGGGGGEKGIEVPTPITRKHFDPVAYFNPSVLTDSKGYASVRFKCPDTMTKYRIYAVACDKGTRFGSNERKITVVKDFYLDPGIPRFLTKGDNFNFSVSAFNKTTKDGTVKFGLKSNENITLDTIGKQTNFSLKSYDRALIPVSGKAEKAGMSELTFSGDFDGLLDAIETKIPVNSGYIRGKDILFGSFSGSKEITYSFPPGTEKIKWEDLNQDEVKCILTVSGSPFLKLSPGLKYLLHYPYGCVEQTSSGILPLAGLRGLIAQGQIPDISIEDTDKFLKAGIERLLSMQTSSGGFGYWSGDIHPSPWGTIYAMNALTRAKMAGLEIPDYLMEKTFVYLKNEIANSNNNDIAFKCFAAYILALNNKLDRTIFEIVSKDKEKQPKENQIVILMSASLGKFIPNETLQKELLNILTSPAEWSRYYGRFSARYLGKSTALLACMTIMPENDIRHKIAQETLLPSIDKQGIWVSTSDTGWALIALGEYFKSSRYAETEVNCVVKNKQNKEWKFDIKPKGSYILTLDSKDFLSNPSFTISTNTNESLMYKLELTFPRVDYTENGFSNGFKITKTIENTSGEKDKIKVGDIVKVIINIDVNNPCQFVVIDDPLPAGLTAINSAIKTEETIPDQNKDNYGWYYWNPSGFYSFVPNFFEIRNDRVLVFKDSVWQGPYEYTYYARAICAGEFVLPSSKIELMYSPETIAYTPVKKVIIEK